MKYFSKILTIFVILFAFTLSLLAYVTNSTLDTANDINDIGGGTVWSDQSGTNAFDNDLGTLGTHSLPYPVKMGVYNLNGYYRLTGFSIANGGENWRQFEDFEILGSRDTTDGTNGTWTLIYANYSWSFPGNPVRCYFDPDDEGGSDPDVFNTYPVSNTLEQSLFTAFQLNIINGSTDIGGAPHVAELEFIGYKYPKGTVIMVR